MSASHPEGEINGIVRTKANTPVVPILPSTSTSSSQTAVKPPASTMLLHAPTPSAPGLTPMEPSMEKQIHKLSQHVIDLI